VTGISAIVGSAAAEHENNTIGGGHRMTVTPSSAETGSDPKAVRDRIVEKMGEQVLPENDGPSLPLPSVEGTLSTPSNTTNLAYVGDARQKYDVHADGIEIKLLDTTHQLLHYRGQEQTSEGRHLNFLWSWDFADTVNPTGFDKSFCKEIQTHLQVGSSDEVLTSMSPSTVSHVNGSYVRTGASVTIGNYGMGLDSEVYVKQGIIGPIGDKVDFGSAGEGATEKVLDGQGEKQRQTHTTTWVVRTPEKLDDISDLDYNWSTYCYGNANNKIG